MLCRREGKVNKVKKLATFFPGVLYKFQEIFGLNPISAGGGRGIHPPPGFSLAIATKINRSTPNFLTFNFYYRDII